MCSPRYSNSLIPEHKHIHQTEPTLTGLKFEEEQHKNINNVIAFLKQINIG